MNMVTCICALRRRFCLSVRAQRCDGNFPRSFNHLETRICMSNTTTLLTDTNSGRVSGAQHCWMPNNACTTNNRAQASATVAHLYSQQPPLSRRGSVYFVHICMRMCMCIYILWVGGSKYGRCYTYISVGRCVRMDKHTIAWESCIGAHTHMCGCVGGCVFLCICICMCTCTFTCESRV